MSWLSEFNKKHDWALPLELGLGAVAGIATGGLALPWLAGEAGLAGAGLFGAEAAGAGIGEGLFGGLAGAGVEGGALGFAEGGALGGESLFGGLGGESAFGAMEGGMGLNFGELPLNASQTAFEGGVQGAGGVGESLAGSGNTALSGAATPQAGAPEAGFWDKIVGGAKDSITKNPLGIGLAGAGLAGNVLKGNQTDPKQKMLEQQAMQLGSQGKVFMDYLTNGTLPPGMQAKLDQATQAAKARIISNHARNGMATDPSQNSALAQELNSVDLNAVSAMAAAQMDMMKTGLSETGLSSQLYEMLIKMDRQNNQDLMQAISSFASALGGSGKTIQLKTA